MTAKVLSSTFSSAISRVRQALQVKNHHYPMLKPLLKTLGLLVVLFGAVFGYKIIKILTFPPYVPPPISVSSARAQRQEWQPAFKAVGTLRAIHGVDITTEAAGLITKIYLTSGLNVKAGDPLVQLNADVEIAQLASLKAEVELAEITLKRDKAQRAIQAVSQASIDADQADLKNKRAQVAQQEAIIAKKRICAPFPGILGISPVNLGQYLNPGDKIVTLQELDPILIDFYLPQQALASLKKGLKINLRTDTYGDQVFTGEITSLDPKVDPSTRNMQIEATLPNADLKLYPGMFGEVKVLAGEPQQHLTLPQTAISFNAFGEIVYIIMKTKDKAGKPVLSVKQSFVTVGETRGDQIAILKGLKEGDEVVVAGQGKLKNGSVVVINNTVLPSSDPNPKLIDE